MAFHKFSLNGALVLIATITFSTADNTIYDTAVNKNLQDYVVPLDYNVEIRYFFEDNILLGLCGIIINISRPLQSIMLHSVPIKVIDAILIDDEKNNTYQIISATFKEKDVLTLLFDTDLLSATHNISHINLKICTLNITYMRNIHDNKNSFFKYAYLREEVKDQNKLSNRLIKKSVEIMKSRQLFPCKDDLAIKSTFKIAVKHYEMFTVLSNMPIQAKYKKQFSTMIWTDFEKSMLISAQYIRVVIIITFTNQTIIDDTNVTIWHRPSLHYATSIMKDIVPYFMQNYPMGLSKLDIVVFPDSQDNFATFGLVLQREADVIFNENLDHHIRKREIAHIIARQLAFLWSYNVLLWSKEGFATFFGAYILDELFQGYDMMNLMVLQAQQESLCYDIPSTIYSAANSSVFPLNYMKSFIIWRMLYHMIPDLFWTGMHNYINQYHNYSSTTIRDFWTTIEIAYQDKFPNWTLNIKKIMNRWMNSWIIKKYYPVLQTRVKNNKKLKNYKNWITRYNQSRYLLANNMTENSIEIPVNTTQLSLNYSRLFWLTTQKFIHIIPRIKNDDLIIVNLQQTGYYRVKYDYTTLCNLILYLNSEKYTKIHALNRAKIIDDAFYFLLQQQLNYHDFWNITNFMLQDINSLTWYTMIKIFESMSCIFPFPTHGDARERMKNLINPIFMEYYITGYNLHRFNFRRSLTEEVKKWACLLNDVDCRELAAIKLSSELENNTRSKILTSKKWIYCYGSLTADNTIWLKILSKFNVRKDERFLEYLTCFENVTIICNYLKQLIFENIQLSRNVRASIFLHIIEKHGKKTEVLSYIFDNIVKVSLSSNWRNDVTAILIVIITHVHSLEHMEMITNFITDFAKRDQRIVETVKKKLKKRRSEYERKVANYISLIKY